VHKKGFTIIELAIVITIVGVIAAAFVPAFMDCTGKRKRKLADPARQQAEADIIKAYFELENLQTVCLQGIEYYFANTGKGYILAPKFLNEGNTAKVSPCALLNQPY
jgi:prepilin-type N-terminal cleavage/methylation domain-containing protein